MLGAWVLIAIGTLLLAANLSQSLVLGLLVLPIVGAIFLVWGVLARHFGPLIPAGILIGLGGGVIAQQWLFAGDAPAGGGVVVLGLGLGFLAISVLALLFARTWLWWPLIPGGILTTVGGTLLTGNIGVALLSALGKIWPGLLIIVGVLLIWRLGSQRDAHH